MVFRFDSAWHLQDREDSAQRQTLLAEGEHLVEATDMHRVSGLETWFDNARRLRELVSKLEAASLLAMETAEGWTDKP